MQKLRTLSLHAEDEDDEGQDESNQDRSSIIPFDYAHEDDSALMISRPKNSRAAARSQRKSQNLRKLQSLESNPSKQVHFFEERLSSSDKQEYEDKAHELDPDTPSESL